MVETCPRCGGEGRSVEVDQSRYCRGCRRKANRETVARRKLKYPFKNYTYKKRSENRKLGFSDCTLTYEHLEDLWTGFCPIFGTPIELNVDRKHINAAHLDRIDPDKGYEDGNVVWLSARANRIKNNATKTELKLVLDFLEGVELEGHFN